MSIRIGSLMAAPDPILGESPSSWLHRLSMLHGTGTTPLLRSMGIQRIGDPDVTLTTEDFFTLVRETEVSEDSVVHFSAIYQYLRPERFQPLLHRAKRRAAYGFCSTCLAEDEIPYLRTTWRFVDWTICPKHHIRIQRKCFACDGSIRAVRPCRSTYGGSLCFCSDCDNDLRLAPVEALSDKNVDAECEYQQALINTFLNGHCLVEGHHEPVSLSSFTLLQKCGQLERSVVSNRSASNTKFRLQCVDGQLFFLFLPGTDPTTI